MLHRCVCTISLLLHSALLQSSHPPRSGPCAVRRAVRPQALSTASPRIASRRVIGHWNNWGHKDDSAVDTVAAARRSPPFRPQGCLIRCVSLSLRRQLAVGSGRALRSSAHRARLHLREQLHLVRDHLAPSRLTCTTGARCRQAHNRCYLKSGGRILPVRNTSSTASAFNCTPCSAGPPGPLPPPPGPPVPVAVDVDGSAASKAFPPFWKRSFGSGHAALTLRPDWQAHLARAVRELGLQGVRCVRSRLRPLCCSAG